MDDVSSNKIVEDESSARVRAKKRIIVEFNTPAERTYTCVGRSGSKTALATTTIYPDHSKPKLSSRRMNPLSSLSGAKKSRIVFYYSFIFETIGKNVLLPCEVSGWPRPNVYWLDVDGNIINNENPRYKVQESGELAIQSLHWNDMGSYTCIAKNQLSKDSISTFLYPVVSNSKSIFFRQNEVY